MLVIMTVALLIFGPKKLPEIGKTLGKTLRGFQDAANEFQNEFKREAELLEQAKSLPQNPTNPPIAQDPPQPVNGEPHQG